MSFVGSDNCRGGHQLIGEFLVKASGGATRVTSLEGIARHETGDSRVREFRDAVKGSPGIVIVASQTANWERDQGFSVFQKHPAGAPGPGHRVCVQRHDGARRD